jgi:Protein of unknown function (DUF3891)
MISARLAFAIFDHIAQGKNSECCRESRYTFRASHIHRAMIIQTAPAGTQRLAVMMYEHTALCGQFARAFGNETFEALAPLDLMVYVIAHHDAGWTEFDRDPTIDPDTGLPYNLIETPAKYITVTSRLSPDFNERQHPFCGLISSMHSWGLYNGRYGLSDHVLIKKFPEQERPLAERMLDGELARQRRLKDEIGKDPALAGRLSEKKLFQNYKQLQFIDTLALYFNRVHRDERGPQTFAHVPLNAEADASVTIQPAEPGVYTLSPFPFAPEETEFAFAGRRISPRENEQMAGWPELLKRAPTEWERFRLMAA